MCELECVSPCCLKRGPAHVVAYRLKTEALPIIVSSAVIKTVCLAPALVDV